MSEDNKKSDELSRRVMMFGSSAAAFAAFALEGLDSPLARAAGALAFGYPCDTHNISDGWDDHIARGSLGGTDFTAGYGSNLYAMADGTVTIADSSPSGSGGRYLRVDHGAMGPYASVNTESLHLAVISVSVGQYVTRGQVIGRTGASAYGSDYGTGGPHVHVHGNFNGVRSNLEPHFREGEPELSQAEVDAIKAHIDARANEVKAHGDAKANEVKAHVDARVGNLLTALRREARARLYFDSGTTGTLTESSATRFVVAKVTDGFIYPLNPDAAARRGQLESLRSTHYLLIDAAEVAEGLITEHFNNMLEMANGHLRRIATEVNRQVEGGTTPAVTGTAPRGTALPTRVLG